MKKIFVIIITILCLGFNFTPNLPQNDTHPITLLIEAPTGNTNTENPFRDLLYFRLWNTSAGWSLVKDYYTDGLSYAFNGVTSSSIINFKTLDDFERLSLDIQFKTTIALTKNTPLNIIMNYNVFYGIGSGESITSSTSSTKVLFQCSSDAGVTWSTFWNIPYTSTSDGVHFVFYPNMNVNLVRIQYNSYTTVNTTHFKQAYYGVLNGDLLYDSGYDTGYDIGYDTGYQTGYDIGYLAGGDNIALSFFNCGMSIIRLVFESLVMLFSTEIVVGTPITVGLIFIGIPGCFMILGGVINLVRRLLGVGG